MATLSPSTSPQARPERPRAVTANSHVSTYSHKSSRSWGDKLELTESARDKRRLEAKSDPTNPLHEAQPGQVALEHSNLEDIRVGQYKDWEGNVITDPDRSNPTRPRMERPLDTIRAFNAAAEGTSSRRSSYQRPPSFSGWENGPAQRGSNYGPPNGMYSQSGRPGPRSVSGGSGYYRHSSYGYMRPDSFPEEGGPVQQGPPRPPHMRHPSQPYMQPDDSPTSAHSHQPSYETMTSGSDEMSKSTNPSSQNSSYDQLHQMGPPKPQGEYLPSPYRQNGGPMRNPYPPSAMPNGYGNGYNNGYGRRPSGPMDDYGMEPTPVSPQRQVNGSTNRVAPMKMSLQRTNSNAQTQRVEEEPKRQSWLKRKLSRRT
ncbi:hypothetical protein LTR70_009593 [Exophiala xenobiotica]|uniref:Uncharacterized protein n=1 Tax=Lithohypha guttulata TaxID=1690604 RepID=A0ABR0JWY5_9EURO|nr:hypothetical protein LTR24_009575 [Lithohypha guttulata]KAK5310282.1 hypothetical protein LTR70_009593 [Exophiala xenobiotica]